MIAGKLTGATLTAAAGLMDVFCGADGKEYLYVQAGSAIAQYDVVTVTEAGSAVPATKALVEDGHQIGVSQVAIASDSYGYVQIRGVAEMAALANCAADVPLYTSATAGSLDDTATSQAKVSGIVATEAAGGTAENIASFMAVRPHFS